MTSPQPGVQGGYPPSPAFYPQFAPMDKSSFSPQTHPQQHTQNMQQSGSPGTSPQAGRQSSFFQQPGYWIPSPPASPTSPSPPWNNMQGQCPPSGAYYGTPLPSSPPPASLGAQFTNMQGFQSPSPTGYYPSPPVSPAGVPQGFGTQGFQPQQPGYPNGAPGSTSWQGSPGFLPQQPMSPGVNQNQAQPNYVPQQPMSPGMSPAQPGYDFSKTDDIFVPPGGEVPPPNFTPYDAKFFTDGHGDIVSHDPHLNEDGEALYRFLLARSQAPPKFQLHLHGEHIEYEKYKVATTDSNGHVSWHTRTEAHTIIDFDFTIDLTRYIATVPVHFTVGDSEAAFRGKLHKELVAPVAAGADVEGGVTLGRRRATHTEGTRAKQWKRERLRKGLPPWVGPAEGWDAMRSPDAITYAPNANVLKSSWTVRQWADEYCASTKLLKEFTYEKIIYGWNIAALESAVRAAVKSTFYKGNFTVNWVRRSTRIHVRADNNFSRALSNQLIVTLLWLTCLYPIVWLIKYFFEGGRWKVCGGGYALKAWQYIQPPQQVHLAGSPSIIQTSGGAAQLVGMKEGEWFGQWEGTIKRAVVAGLQSKTPLMSPDVAPSDAAVGLEGYTRYEDATRY